MILCPVHQQRSFCCVQSFLWSVQCSLWLASTKVCAHTGLLWTGIWGGKGQGKTFQVTLAFKKLNINPIVMSAGELESGNAGEPAKLIRQRYREASDTIKKGKMASMFINDLDAGTLWAASFSACQQVAEPPAGAKAPTHILRSAAIKYWLLSLLQFGVAACRSHAWMHHCALWPSWPCFRGVGWCCAGAGRMGNTTQYTVNNQMVNATLMNIADNPTNVQMPGVYKEESIPRVPIVCTGNDFSTLYAPLIRDGRMEKFYWAPTREDRIGVCTGIFQVSSRFQSLL